MLLNRFCICSYVNSWLSAETETRKGILYGKANSLGFVDVPRLNKELKSLEKLKDDLYDKYIKPDRIE